MSFPSSTSQFQEGNGKRDSVALDLSFFSRVSLPNLAASRIVVDCILGNVSDRDTIPLVSVFLRDISASGNILQCPGKKSSVRRRMVKFPRAEKLKEENKVDLTVSVSCRSIILLSECCQNLPWNLHLPTSRIIRISIISN